MKDPDFEAYCEHVESAFFRLKGRPGALSPADFALTRAWFDLGFPLEAVLDGIEEAFRAHASGREGGTTEVNSLSFCASFVERAAEGGKIF